VAHSCNSSYCRDRDQEDHGSKPAWTNSLRDPILKKLITKIRLVDWPKVKALSSNPSTGKQKFSEKFLIHNYWQHIIIIIAINIIIEVFIVT
jgi:hypothetical protein